MLVTITSTLADMVQQQRVTKQGAVVRDALRSLDGFRSAQDVFAAIRSHGGT